MVSWSGGFILLTTEGSWPGTRFPQRREEGRQFPNASSSWLQVITAGKNDDSLTYPVEVLHRGAGAAPTRCSLGCFHSFLPGSYCWPLGASPPLFTGEGVSFRKPTPEMTCLKVGFTPYHTPCLIVCLTLELWSSPVYTW